MGRKISLVLEVEARVSVYLLIIIIICLCIAINELMGRKAIFNQSMSRNKQQRKREATQARIGVSKMLLKSQCSDFEFKRDCLCCVGMSVNRKPVRTNQSQTV
jgi:hypothetical protein